MGTRIPAEYHHAVLVAGATARACPLASTGRVSASQPVLAAAATYARPGRRASLTWIHPLGPATRADAYRAAFSRRRVSQVA